VEVPLLVFAVRYVGGNWQALLPRSPWAQGLVLAAVVLLGAVAAWAIRRRLRR
jgi:membrane protein DedA with SNARE-associated domain